ncbi:DUF2510 domain-containing protein [Kitasatospora sp. NPDC051853]|uniref:DUF2510 domain-containing protein n=1 Tax=Kitasatospora sp. NPDC051853 TaxID=3364058 RepID=UPI0037B833D6
MSEQIPAGWYPDPQDTTSDPRPQRWWDGQGWTASTRPAPADAPAPATAADDAADDAPTVLSAPVAEPTPTVLTGEVLENGAAYRYPEPPPFAHQPQPKSGPSKPVLIVAAVAALAGLLVGSGVTYLAMDGRADRRASERIRPDFRPGGDGAEGRGAPDAPGSSASPKSPDGKGPDGKGGKNAGLAVDVVNKLSLSVPSGWKSGTTKDGFAAMSVGSYTCASGDGECSLGGANTGQLQGGDPKQAAEQDINAAAEQAYGKIKSHEQLKSEPIAVDGRDGWLVRWKVDAPEGNDGYVQTVVFPTADGKGLATLHLGFDIADKAPTLSQMDKIVESVKAFNGRIGEGGPGTGT